MIKTLFPAKITKSRKKLKKIVAMIHPFVIYFKEAGELKHLNYVIISECKTHDAVAFYLFNVKAPIMDTLVPIMERRVYLLWNMQKCNYP